MTQLISRPRSLMRMLWVVAAGCMLSPFAKADTSVCSGQVRTLDWSSISWTDGALSNTFTIAGDQVSIVLTGNTSDLDVAEGRQSPFISSVNNGGLGGTEQALRIRPAYTDLSHEIDVTVTLGTPGIGVEAKDFLLFDVDSGSDFVDTFTITASLGGVDVPVALSGGSAINISGQIATGTTSVPQNSGAGTLNISVAAPFDTLVFNYKNSLTGGGAIGNQSIWLHDLEFCERQPDLSLSVTPPSGPILSGYGYDFEITATNEGVVDATGVEVEVDVPAGYQFVSHDGGADYDESTGIWTIGALATGANAVLTVRLAPLATGSYDVAAEISAMSGFDHDSTPGNGVTSEDDYDVASPSVSRGTGGSFPALTCSAGFEVLDWDLLTWTGSATSQTVAADAGTDVTVSFAGDIPTMDSFGHNTNNGFTGGLVPAEDSLRFFANFSDISESFATTFVFSPPGGSVDDLSFRLFDVDSRGSRTYSDGARITGYLSGAPVLPVIVSEGPANSVNGNEVVGLIGNGSTSANGNVRVAFTSPIDSFTLEVFNGEITSRQDPTNQGYSVHDLSFCSAFAKLAGAKTVEIFDPSGAGLHALPGNDVAYTIEIKNVGDGPVDAGTIDLIDTLPAEAEFYNGDFDPLDGDTNPVLFTQSGAGLNFNYARDVAFSNSAMRPTGFADCTYSPAPGYDPNVTHICIAPNGAMQAGTPDPAASFAFRMRIR